MRRVSRVTTAILATVMTSGLVVAAVPATSSATSGTPSVTPAPKPASFNLASFNVLGASHTLNGARGMASGAVRIVRANQLLERHHVDVAGFQEMQASQLTKFLSITNGEWVVYPGLSIKKIDSENSIGWRTDKFTLVQATTVKIPYFNGSPRRMPLVLLRDKASGMLAYFANYHNPADTARYHHQAKWRAEANRVQIALQNQIWTRGIPRFVTGDMNERAPYFCRVARSAPLKAARPNTYIKDRTCYANRPRAVDWILGARKVTFSNYDEDRSHLVDITTDHPVISSTVTVDPARLPRAWATTPPPPVVPKVTY
jgi:hypothetical protein